MLLAQQTNETKVGMTLATHALYIEHFCFQKCTFIYFLKQTDDVCTTMSTGCKWLT